MEALNVDEVVGQLLASEGFTSVEELALVDAKELAAIEGFDEETAGELQARARDYLAQIEAELRRQAQGTRRRRRTQGRARRHHRRCWWRSARTASRRSRTSPAAPPTIWSAGPSARTARRTAMPAFSTASTSRATTAEAMIMQARVKAGWITEADLAAGAGGRRAGRSRAEPARMNRRRTRSRCWRVPTTRIRYRTRGTPGSRERLCVVTPPVRPIDELIRFVVAPGRRGGAGPQAQAAGPRGLGDGDAQAVAEAVRRKRVRSAVCKREVTVAAGPGRTRRSACWSARALDALAIARKAGQVVAGFAKVEAADRARARPSPSCTPPRPAADGIAQDRRRAEPACRRRRCRAIFRGFAHLPRPNWIWHWAGQMWYMLRCSPGARGETFLARWRTLERYRTGDAGRRGTTGRRQQPNARVPQDWDRNDRYEEPRRQDVDASPRTRP